MLEQHTIAYCNSDPTNISNWVGLGESILPSGGEDVAYNSSDGYFYAVGISSNTYRIYKSNDGANWSVTTDIVGQSFYSIGVK